jgi:hypothetical protein
MAAARFDKVIAQGSAEAAKRSVRIVANRLRFKLARLAPTAR